MTSRTVSSWCEADVYVHGVHVPTRHGSRTCYQCFASSRLHLTADQYVVADGKIKIDGAGGTPNEVQGEILVITFVWLPLSVFYCKCSRMLCAYYSNSEFRMFSN